MDPLANTPRRLTRASIAAMSASKDKFASPVPIKKTPAKTPGRTPAGTLKAVAVKTPLSTGKRGRPRKVSVSAVKATNEEIKENIPNENTDETKAIESVKKVLHLVNPDIIPNVAEKESETEIGEKVVPEIKIIEASLINQTVELETAEDKTETLNKSKIEETPIVVMEATTSSTSDEIKAPDEAKETKVENVIFDETLNFSKLEENSSNEKVSTALPQKMESENVSDVGMVQKIQGPEVIDLTDSTIELNSDPIPVISTESDKKMEVDSHPNPIQAIQEDDYIAKLCAEAGQEKQGSDPICMEETLNGTFQIDDSVFGPEIIAPTPTPLSKVPNITTYDTIVIEDTPLKPKTPQITLRRPFRKQQHSSISDVFSVAAEKSILKRKKRSLSMGDINSTMQERHVKFNSPANMTVQINEIDDRMMKSFAETNGRHQRAARRKRSLSDADYTQMKSQKIESAKKNFKSKKMPDFAAIHSKQIKKMESIADNLARKQERALYLTTPVGAKVVPVDLKQDTTSSNKKQLDYNNGDTSIRTENVPSSTTIKPDESTVALPKVCEDQKIEETTHESTEIIKTMEPAINTTEEIMPEEASTSIVKDVSKPKTKPFAFVTAQKSVEKFQFKPKTHPLKPGDVFKFAAESTLSMLKTGNNELVKPVNLAERINKAHVGTSSSTSSMEEVPEGSRTAIKKKVNREEEHKNLYKANPLSVYAPRMGVGILRGVRLNRRFELQMKSREMKKE